MTVPDTAPSAHHASEEVLSVPSPTPRGRFLSGSLVRWLLAANGLLAAVFVVVFVMTWRRMPTEAVKLHGNIDVGIDLLGDRRDLIWVALGAVAILTANVGLAMFLRTREPVAALFLLAGTVPLLVGFVGGLLFIWSLNRAGGP